MSFLEELKRRNVYRVAIAYALVAWMLVNVTSVFVPALNLPAWTVSLVALLVIVGFPVALGFAWVYELTPEGLKRSADIRVEHSVKHVTARKLNNFIFGALVVALVLLALDDYVMHGRTVLATSAAASTARIDSTNGPVSPERAVTTPSPTIITRFDYVVPEEINLGAPARAMLSIAQSGELFAFSG